MACLFIDDSRWITVFFGPYSDIRRELLVHSKPARNDIAVRCISYVPWQDNVESPFQSEHCQFIAGPKMNFELRNDLRGSAPYLFSTPKPPPIANPVLLFRKFSKISGQPADLQECNYLHCNFHPHVTCTAPLHGSVCSYVLGELIDSFRRMAILFKIWWGRGALQMQIHVSFCPQFQAWLAKIFLGSKILSAQRLQSILLCSEYVSSVSLKLLSLVK